MFQSSRFSIILILTSTITIMSCGNDEDVAYKIEQYQSGKNGLVVSAHPISSSIGLDILKAGGTAIEAAVAVQFAQAVVNPRAGNLGGGGFAIVRTGDQKVDALDYREKAPSGASRAMYQDASGAVVKGLSTHGGLSIGVPGTVDGMAALLSKYGSDKTLAALIEPSIEVAERGFKISQAEADRLNRYKSEFIKYCSESPFVKETQWMDGDLIKQPALAATLKAIAEGGRDAYYHGEHAEKLVNKIKSLNGIVTTDDMIKYNSVWRAPIQHVYKDFNVISMPPPSSGGIVLAQMLTMLEQLEIDTLQAYNMDYIHAIAEVEKRAYADRAKYLGDSDFYDVPVEELLDSDYLEEKLNNYSSAAASKSEDIYNDIDFEVLESYETTHTSIVDMHGNAVSITTTLNSNYGSKVFFEEGGYFLNNEMDDFSSKPGTPNQFGLVGGEANAIEANKRMLSSMTPTIIERNDDIYMVLGSPGGSTIITSVLQVFLNVSHFGWTLPEAVNHKRFHHQWLPNHILMEKGLLNEIQQDSLKLMGHVLSETEAIGKVKVILKEGDLLIGVGDKRNIDDAVYTY